MHAHIKYSHLYSVFTFLTTYRVLIDLKQKYPLFYLIFCFYFVVSCLLVIINVVLFQYFELTQQYLNLLMFFIIHFLAFALSKSFKYAHLSSLALDHVYYEEETFHLFCYVLVKKKNKHKTTTNQPTKKGTSKLQSFNLIHL